MRLQEQRGQAHEKIMSMSRIKLPFRCCNFLEEQRYLGWPNSSKCIVKLGSVRFRTIHMLPGVLLSYWPSKLFLTSNEHLVDYCCFYICFERYIVHTVGLISYKI